ncbi:LOW QUALITY PROTEIN: non-structural maintenance of chromosomes element 4 homolog A-like [Manis pentadactyla]|uniref:LOW QUALITY PROTEIN: non-structural maintenance of chromosomes element 4 homolog A-like n=1 Tax=Manis pentadactyla TaxID=143292 RepID=UPI00255C2A25|nr:LOW QUALITY PROTEIN: non-structural maintenance of chromosomes element 4 homolog A-like [Manis pentadactyla]
MNPQLSIYVIDTKINRLRGAASTEPAAPPWARGALPQPSCGSARATLAGGARVRGGQAAVLRPGVVGIARAQPAREGRGGTRPGLLSLRSADPRVWSRALQRQCHTGISEMQLLGPHPGPRLQESSPLGEENREDILNASDKLTEVLEEANTLFNGVSRAREAVLDAHFLVLALDLGKGKAKQLRSDLNSFDMLRYVETLLTHMGVNPLEAEELIRDEDSSDFEFIVYDSWKISGKTAENTFNKTHTFHFLLGSIQGGFPVPKPRTYRPRKNPKAEVKQAMPDQLQKMEASHQEATEKEVERILGLLQTYFREDPDTPMSYFDFVVDPHSFPRTVENIFHVSFIIRDGFARIRLDQDQLPIIEPINDESEGIDQNTQIRNQGIIALSYRDWEEIVKTFEISEPVIASGQSQ